MQPIVQEPKKRSPLRKKLGKEFFCIRRRFHWFFSSNKWAKPEQNSTLTHCVKTHRSLILRQLKDVEMYLQHNKRTNLSLAAKAINGTVIRPGETFSFWKLVGKPTAKRGFKEGLVLDSGKIATGIGGGLCQMGNLLHWMFLHTPLTITERYRHGYDVFPDVSRKIPFGSGATLAYNYIDLQVKNNTNHTFQLTLFLDDYYLNGKISTDSPLPIKYEVEELDHLFRHEPWGGYTRHNRIIKKSHHLNGEFIDEEVALENHAIMMYCPFLEDPKK